MCKCICSHTTHTSIILDWISHSWFTNTLKPFSPKIKWKEERKLQKSLNCHSKMNKDNCDKWALTMFLVVCAWTFFHQMQETLYLSYLYFMFTLNLKCYSEKAIKCKHFNSFVIFLCNYQWEKWLITTEHLINANFAMLLTLLCSQLNLRRPKS